MKKVTYIIAHKESTHDRKINLYTVLDWLNYVDEIEEVIVVEQDENPKNINLEAVGLNKNYKLTYKFIKNPNNFFNKCWAFNVGSKMSNTEWICFGDNDVMMDIFQINESIKNNINSDNDSFSPYSIVYDMTPSETQELINNKNYDFSVVKSKSIRHGAPYAGGIFFIKRNKFFEVGAWDERFINWGAEDEDMSDRISKLIKSIIDNRESFHLHHSRNIESTFENKSYSDNLNLLTYKMNSNIKDYLNDFNIDNIGIEDKYI